MKVIAHRGANKEALENSFSAYNLAVDAGSERIELDVFRSIDNEFFINHDDSLIHTTGFDKKISTSRTEDLKKMKLKNGEALPMLEDVLNLFLEKVEINIEMKESSEEAAGVLIDLLDNKFKKQLSKILVSSFNPDPLIYIARNAPHIQRACLWGDVVRWPKISFFAPNIFMSEAQAYIIHPHTSFVDEEFMDQANYRGWIVYPYVSMDGEDESPEELWSELYRFGVHGLCTNKPREMNKWLRSIS